MYSELHRDSLDLDDAVITIEENNLFEIIYGLDLSQWIFKLYVNGRRIKNPEQYLLRKGYDIRKLAKLTLEMDG